MITCPCCKTEFTINEMIEQWGYDIGDFQPDIVSDWDEPTCPEPEWDWDEFFASLPYDVYYGESKFYNPLEELPFPIGNVGSS